MRVFGTAILLKGLASRESIRRNQAGFYPQGNFVLLKQHMEEKSKIVPLDPFSSLDCQRTKKQDILS
jgi:hypothetical protein